LRWLHRAWLCSTMPQQGSSCLTRVLFFRKWNEPLVVNMSVRQRTLRGRGSLTPWNSEWCVSAFPEFLDKRRRGISRKNFLSVEWMSILWKIEWSEIDGKAKLFEPSVFKWDEWKDENLSIYAFGDGSVCIIKLKGLLYHRKKGLIAGLPTTIGSLGIHPG